MTTQLIIADYRNPAHAEAIIELLDGYAQDPMGGGEPLTQYTKDNLVYQLSQFPGAFSLLAYHNNKPAGLANCFIGFSTFACQKLVNIHDFVVSKQYRGQGISQKLLQAIETYAYQHNCCKITLEVLSKNDIAKSAYQKFGFTSYQLDDNAGQALFWQKKLS